MKTVAYVYPPRHREITKERKEKFVIIDVNLSQQPKALQETPKAHMVHQFLDALFGADSLKDNNAYFVAVLADGLF